MLLRTIFKVLRYVDEKLLVKCLSFDQYFSFHKALGFPLKKMAFLFLQGYKLNLKNPKTYNEKVVYRQLFERNPLLPVIVDKYAVREYVKNKIGEKYLIPVLQVVDSFDEIDFSQLPDDYIIKVTHGSGRNIIFKDGKNLFGYDQKKLKSTVENWLIEKYAFQKLIWFVQPIKRKIMIEKLLVDAGNIPKDYKFFVFEGKVEFIQVDQDRFLSSHIQNYYDRNWKRIEFTWWLPNGELDEKPESLDNMIELAETLASEVTHMRVDLYTLGSDIYFGELTPCHAGGAARFNPIVYDTHYGEKWENHTDLMRKIYV